MTWDLHDYRVVTASAYPGMMAPLTWHPSCVCVLSGDADPSLGAGRAAALSLEAMDGVRRRWRFGDVARLAEFVPRVLGDAAADDRPILLVPPRAGAAWEAAAATWPGRVRLAASPVAVVGVIAEDKILVRAALRRLGLPVPDQLVVPPELMEFRAVAARLGLPFVAQSPSGAGGQGTYLIAEPADLAAAVAGRPQVDRWLLSRFAGETTINVAGIVHVDGTRLLPLSVQASGIGELGFEFGAYCGSDFGAAAISDRVRREAYRHAAAVGEWLRERGHLGLFGVDIAVSGDELALLEVNPRIQGSSWLLSRLQQRQGGVPCLERHVEALLGKPLGALTAPAVEVTAGSHLIIRWSGPPVVVESVPTQTSIDAVAVTAMPQVGVTLLPGAILARLAAGDSLADPAGHALRPAATAMVERVTAGFELVAVPDRSLASV